MESLRLTRDAIMPVGYDTLELMSVSAALKPRGNSRLLDLCCGCGCQGIFALLSNPGAFSELVCSDIDERAYCFATANIALNIRDNDKVCYVVKGDLYNKVKGPFGCILSNPPFVAIPSANGSSPQTSPALYTVGSGIDGTELLERLLKQSIQYLKGKDSLLLVVTELPNIELS